MKTQSTALETHRALGTTTFATCWKVTRTDGAVYGFTNVDTSFMFELVVYSAAIGMVPSTQVAVADLSVNNMEVKGVLRSDSFTEADVLLGLWDNAEVEIFEVNYKDLTMGDMPVSYGRLGNMQTGRGSFTVEVRSLTQFLQQPVGESYTAACPADLGDTRCGVDISTATISAAVDFSFWDYQFYWYGMTEPDGYFAGGSLTWLTGANAGATSEVVGSGSSLVTLGASLPNYIDDGDTFEMVPGCQKRFTEDCVGKFNNGNRFRGFKDVPLNDKIIGQAGLS